MRLFFPHPMIRRQGFTLIEIIFVMVVIGILSAVVLPRFVVTFQDLAAKTFAQRLLVLVQRLQQEALVKGGVFRLVFDEEKGEVYTAPQDTEAPHKTYKIPSGADLVFDKTEIFFYPDGGIDSFSVKILAPSNRGMELTTKGVWQGVILKESE